jgi:hypothetical protein
MTIVVTLFAESGDCQSAETTERRAGQAEGKLGRQEHQRTEVTGKTTIS